MIEDRNAGQEDGADAGESPEKQDEKQSSQSRMTYVFLIRHGENDWVETGKLAGRSPGVHLNQKGREQSDQLAELLKAQPISAVYSSPLVRCVETAEPVAKALGVPVTESEGLLEVDYGEWRGGELKELSKLPEWQLVQIYPGGFRFPSGETLREVQFRVVTAIEQIRLQHEGEAVALFAHGDILRTSLAYYLGAPLDLFQRIQISTASISLIAFHRFGPRILLMNQTGEIPVISWGKSSRESNKEKDDQESKEEKTG